MYSIYTICKRNIYLYINTCRYIYIYIIMHMCIYYIYIRKYDIVYVIKYTLLTRSCYQLSIRILLDKLLIASFRYQSIIDKTTLLSINY